MERPLPRRTRLPKPVTWHDMAEQQKNGNGHKWLVISLPILAAIAGVLGFFYGIGQRGGKITEVVDWKTETAPRIERMDSKGTISFELFHIQYDKEQAQQYERIKDLEKEVKQIEVLKARLDDLKDDMRKQRNENSN